MAQKKKTKAAAKATEVATIETTVNDKSVEKAKAPKKAQKASSTENVQQDAKPQMVKKSQKTVTKKVNAIQSNTAVKKDDEFKNTEKLTRDDKEQLRESGHSASDISEISHGIAKTTYFLITVKDEPKQITETEAIGRLGREEWLRAISRSTFYAETTRYGLNGERIRVNTKLWAH